MKKRMLKKVKKLFPLVVTGILALILLTYPLYHSVDSFIKLHNGAAYASIAGHKYSPVINETLILALAGIAVLVAVKLVTKWNNLKLGVIGAIICMLIGSFADWALRYTHQNVAAGFTTIIAIILSVATFAALLLAMEAYIRKKRKQTHSQHRFVKLSDAIEMRKEYVCICGRGGNLSLGLAWEKKANVILLSVFGSMLLLISFIQPVSFLGLIVLAAVVAAIAGFNYRSMYRDMIKHGHTSVCAKRFAKIGVWYQARGSNYYIQPQRSRRSKKSLV